MKYVRALLLVVCIAVAAIVLVARASPGQVPPPGDGGGACWTVTATDPASPILQVVTCVNGGSYPLVSRLQ